MGVFIISPNDKGGRLYNAPEKLKNIVKPNTPIQWNAKFCLQDPAIHTLSFGMIEKSHFDEMKGIFPVSVPLNETDSKILNEMDRQLLLDPYALYSGYDLANDPSGLNIPEILRMRRMWKCYDMIEFGKFRYNLFEPEHHWFPGEFAIENYIAKIDMSKVPANIPLKEMIAESHRAFYKLKKS
jgi:predicted aldo/keto reductase-like oxidoreductase